MKLLRLFGAASGGAALAFLVLVFTRQNTVALIPCVLLVVLAAVFFLAAEVLRVRRKNFEKNDRNHNSDTSL